MSSALRSAIERYVERNPRSLAAHEAACRSLPGGNTRSVLFHDPFPLTMERGQDVYLWDVDGHCYVDFLGDFTAGLFGHSNPRIAEAIREALDSGLSLSAHNRYEARLAETVTERFPGIDLVRFTNSGTEANLMALGAARQFTGRSKVLVFSGGYHGGVLSFGGETGMNVPLDFLVARYNDLEDTERLVQEHGAKLGAILVEPMQGAGGCIPGTAEFLQLLRDLATRTGAVLIYDEVMTSRLSTGGRQLQLGIIPDMTTLGKYLGGGLSFGAFGGHRNIMALFDPRRPGHLHHSGTFNNNVLSMAAGAAGMRDVLSEGVLDELNARGERLRERLNTLCEAHQTPLRFSGLGSLMAVQSTVPAEERELFYYYLLEQGIYIGRRGFFALMLPIEDEHCNRLVETVAGYIASREHGRG